VERQRPARTGAGSPDNDNSWRQGRHIHGLRHTRSATTWDSRGASFGPASPRTTCRDHREHDPEGDGYLARSYDNDVNAEVMRLELDGDGVFHFRRRSRHRLRRPSRRRATRRSSAIHPHDR
jgi:hypothetical protein